jgi:glyoxylase-like metal-dependent hydrolase (beta-lactamase superfamily II)
MIFRQLFNPVDSAMTYLIGDPVSREAVVIDPLKYQATLIRALLAEYRLRLKYVLRTHVHAPNRVDCGDLCPHTGAQFVIGRNNAPTLAGDRVGDGDVLHFGDESIAVIETPGHTPGCVTYYWRDRIFCGDVLELGGCGQAVDETDAGQMYDSVRKRIYSLPGETLIFPGHDYAGRTVSTVAEERQRNVVFSSLSRDRFIEHLAQVEKRPVLPLSVDPAEPSEPTPNLPK